MISSAFNPKTKEKIPYTNKLAKEIIKYMNNTTISDEQKVNDISKLIYKKLTTEILEDLPKDKLTEIMAKL